jgi:hypothetical protein
MWPLHVKNWRTGLRHFFTRCADNMSPTSGLALASLRRWPAAIRETAELREIPLRVDESRWSLSAR